MNICKECGKEFHPKGSNKNIFCSRICLHKFRTKECVCRNCGKIFEVPKSAVGAFCSKKCKYDIGNESVNCLKCGKSFIVNKCEYKKYCSQKCANARGNNSKGGRIIDGNGYILVWNPKHPFSQKKGYVFEHRLIMEKMIGRYLVPGEVIHHRNGIKSDNSIGNLVLFSKHSDHVALEHRLGIYPQTQHLKVDITCPQSS